jgi:hypothetical protein
LADDKDAEDARVMAHPDSAASEERSVFLGFLVKYTKRRNDKK